MRPVPTGSGSGSASGFRYPGGLAVNSAGDVFVADRESQSGEIDEILPDGSETTVGSGLDYQGSVFVAPDQDLYVGYGYGVVAKITPDGTQTELAPAVRGLDPIADSAGNVFAISHDKVWEYPIKDATSTGVTCGPEAPAGTAQTCTATVSDTISASDTPTGTVHFTHSGKGTVTRDGTCTLAAGTCSIKFTTGVVGTQTITATYSGDKGHQTSSGATTLTADPKG